jgi:hypothetical protein
MNIPNNTKCHIAWKKRLIVSIETKKYKTFPAWRLLATKNMAT